MENILANLGDLWVGHANSKHEFLVGLQDWKDRPTALEILEECLHCSSTSSCTEFKLSSLSMALSPVSFVNPTGQVVHVQKPSVTQRWELGQAIWCTVFYMDSEIVLTYDKKMMERWVQFFWFVSLFWLVLTGLSWRRPRRKTTKTMEDLPRLERFRCVARPSHSMLWGFMDQKPWGNSGKERAVSPHSLKLLLGFWGCNGTSGIFFLSASISFVFVLMRQSNAYFQIRLWASQIGFAHIRPLGPFMPYWFHALKQAIQDIAVANEANLLEQNELKQVTWISGGEHPPNRSSNFSGWHGVFHQLCIPYAEHFHVEHALHGQGMAHTLLLNAMAMKLQRGHYEESWKAWLHASPC